MADDQSILPHGSFVQLAENLWWLQGSLKGMSLKRCMVVVKLASGGLLIHNAIELDEATRQQFESFGRPAILVVPSAIHRLDAPRYKARYPQLRVYAPSGARAEVEKVVAVDATYEQFQAEEAAALLPLAGVDDREGVLRVHSKDGTTIVVNDVVFNMDKKTDFLGWAFTTVMGSAPGPRISRLGKLLLVKNKPALKADLLRFADTPDLVRFIVGHEKVAHGADAAAALRQASTYL